MVWLPGVALCEVAGELEPEAEPLVLWLVEPPEAEPDFFSGSLGVDVEDELEPDDGVLGVAEDEELDVDGELGGVADDEDEEPDGVVTLPPPEALPEAEPEPDGVLGVVAEDDDEPEPAGPARWLSLSPQAARPRAIATEIARVESLMSPPRVGFKPGK